MDTMSKLTAPVTSSVLISLAVFLGMSPNISAGLQRALSANTANVHLAGGVKNQAVLNGQGSIAAPADTYYQLGIDRPHGCHSGDYYNPADD
jgi:hypothetical protein